MSEENSTATNPFETSDCESVRRIQEQLQTTPDLLAALRVNSDEMAFNSASMLPSLGIKNYIEIRQKIKQDLEIRHVQNKVNSKLFGKKENRNIELFFYDKDKYHIEIEEVETEYESEIEERVKKIDRVVENSYSEEKEVHRKKESTGLVEMEAMCSVSTEGEGDEEGNSDLESFIDRKEIEADLVADGMKFEWEENLKEIQKMEQALMKRYGNTKKIELEGTSEQIEIQAPESDFSNEIEEINLNDDFVERSRLFEDSGFIWKECEKEHDSLKQDLTFETKYNIDIEAAKNRLKSDEKRIFKGFK